jgi:hypothetical protein
LWFKSFNKTGSTKEVSHEPSTAFASMAVCCFGSTVHDSDAHYFLVMPEQVALGNIKVAMRGPV